MMSQKRFFSKFMGFILIARNNLSEKSSHAKKVALQCTKQLRYGFLKFKLLHTKLSYLVLVPEVRNRC